MSSIQGITLAQLPAASNIQDTNLTYLCNPSGNPTDLQASMSLVSSYVGSNIINDAKTTATDKTYSIDKIISLLQSVQPAISEIKYSAKILPSTNWILCDGRTVQINDYPDLFAAIGTSFGGNGTTTFAVPNLKGRMLMATGTASGGGINRLFGNFYGAESQVLNSQNLPSGTTATTVGTNYGALPLTSAASIPSSPVITVPPVCIAGNFYIFAKNLF